MEEEEVIFSSTTSGAESFYWNFGDGMLLSGTSEVGHVFTAVGTFPVILTAGRDECSDTAIVNIYVINVTGIDETENPSAAGFSIFPNPATTVAYLKLDLKENVKDAVLAVVDAAGRVVYQKNMPQLQAGQLIEIPVNQLAKGNYQVLINASGFRAVNRLAVAGK